METQAGAPESKSEKNTRESKALVLSSTSIFGRTFHPCGTIYLVEIEDLRAKGKAWGATAPSSGLFNIPQYIPMPMLSPYTLPLMTL